jgi:hypothetical protein
MIKKLTVKNRINLTIGLLAVFLLVLGTNRIDHKHFETVQNALSTVYNDRVLAQDYVYKMNNLVHKQKEQYRIGANASTILTINKEIRIFMDLFSSTALTTKESKAIKSMEESFEKLAKQETGYFSNKKPLESVKTNDIEAIILSLTEFQIELNKLSLIQVSESKNITSTAQKSLDTNQLMSNMEIGSLIVIGIVIQFLIFYRSKKSNDVVTS